MAKSRTFWTNLRGALGPAAALTIVAFFGGYALFGSNGALAWGDYSKRLHDRKVELARVEIEHAQLVNRVKLLDPRHADPDYVDEIARRELGVVGKDEMIVRLH